MRFALTKAFRTHFVDYPALAAALESLGTYFWLDEMIMDLWSEYIDFIIDEKPIEQCDNKIKLIEFYQNEIDKLSTEITFQEAHKWGRENNIMSTTQRMYEKLFGHYKK